MFGYYDRNYCRQTVRQISISISKFVDEYEAQLNLFYNNSWKKRKIGYFLYSFSKFPSCPYKDISFFNY
ncbi:hypothetical protein CHH55_19820 [Niallia circulans]|nr:hypothetical protein CHH55_19820 [Niallia circulans]